MSTSSLEYEGPIPTGSISVANESTELQRFTEVNSKIEAFLEQHQSLLDLVMHVSQQPSDELLSAILTQASNLKREFEKLFMDTALFVSSEDDILIRAGVHAAAEVLNQTVDATKKINPATEVVILGQNFEVQLYQQLIEDEQDQDNASFEIATNTSGYYDTSIDGLLSALNDSPKITAFFELQEKKLDNSEETRDRLLNIGSTALAITLGLSLFELAKKLTRKGTR